MATGNSILTPADVFKSQMPGDPPSKGIPWLWTGKTTNGYGRLYAQGRHWRAHVVSYSIYVGPVPPGMFVLHELDIPLDVNPYNLRLGTHEDNMHDMVKRGRSARSESHGLTFFTEDQVKAMRILYASGQFSIKELSEQYKCSYSLMHKILRSENWKYVEPISKEVILPNHYARGVEQGKAVLNDDIVLEARQMYAQGKTIADISRDLGINRSTLKSVLSGKTWTHIPMPDGIPGFSISNAGKRAALDENKARMIKQRTRDGASVRTIADELAVSYRTVWGVVNGKTWRHVD